MFYKVFRSNNFPHCPFLGMPCDCKVDLIPDEKSNNVHLGVYLYPTPKDDLCESVEKLVERLISSSDTYVYAQCYFTYCFRDTHGAVKSAPVCYKDDDAAMDIATDTVVLVNKTLSEVIKTMEGDEDENYDNLLKRSTIYIDIKRSMHPIEDYKIEGCLWDDYTYNSLLAGVYIGSDYDNESVAEKFGKQRRLNLPEPRDNMFVLSSHGHRRGFKKFYL